MTDLACRSIAGGAPVLHSSHMAAYYRTLPCAGGKASTPFLEERRLVSKVRMVRARVQRGAPVNIAGKSRVGSGWRTERRSRKRFALKSHRSPGEIGKTNERRWRTISYFPVRVDDAAGLLWGQVVDVGALMLLRHGGEPRSRRRQPRPETGLIESEATVDRLESSRVQPSRAGLFGSGWVGSGGGWAGLDLRRLGSDLWHVVTDQARKTHARLRGSAASE